MSGGFPSSYGGIMNNLMGLGTGYIGQGLQNQQAQYLQQLYAQAANQSLQQAYGLYGGVAAEAAKVIDGNSRPIHEETKAMLLEWRKKLCLPSDMPTKGEPA